MTILNHKHILLGVTSSIAAYKSVEIVSRLVKQGAQVRVVMTRNATEFVAPLTFQTLSQHPVRVEMFAKSNASALEHIDLARWADAIIIAPASANFIARLSHGLADDLLSTLCLATDAKIAIAPAMNVRMWENSVTQENVQALKKREIQILEPNCGHQACGEIGKGRMLEPEQIVEALSSSFQTKQLSGKHVLITAGPTYEAIDPVRYIGNYSSGKMGFALATAAIEAGASVTLISGPAHLSTPEKVRRIDVISAQDMYESVIHHALEVDVFIGVAAVSDYRCETVQAQKIKRTQDIFNLKMVKTPDILRCVSHLPKRPYIVGFAAESENLVENARQKLQEKQLDMVVANLIGQPNQGFASENNILTVLFADQKIDLPFSSKQKLGHKLIQIITQQLAHHGKNKT